MNDYAFENCTFDNSCDLVKRLDLFIGELRDERPLCGDSVKHDWAFSDGYHACLYDLHQLLVSEGYLSEDAA